MVTRPTAIGGIALLLFLGLSPGLAQEPAPEPAPKCGDCHDQAKTFHANPHARGQIEKGEVPNAVCETCHGDGAAHIEAGGDKTLITVPRGRKGADETCLMCHDSVANDRHSRRTGAHANSEAVNCLSCHSIHSAEEPVGLVARTQPALCATCHTQAASFKNKPYTHRMGRAGLSCSSCHDPHARPGKENIRLTAAGEVACLGCHSDKRGPYVFEHGAMHGGDDVTGCLNCHEAHGSSNPKQLKRATVMQVCIECHSPLTHDTLGSQPPSFHNLNQPRYQNCTTCHTAVHGSNRSPALIK